MLNTLWNIAFKKIIILTILVSKWTNDKSLQENGEGGVGLLIYFKLHLTARIVVPRVVEDLKVEACASFTKLVLLNEIINLKSTDPWKNSGYTFFIVNQNIVLETNQTSVSDSAGPFLHQF